MNTEDFYALIPEAIGQIEYIAKTAAPSETAIQNIAGQISSQNFGSYLANYALTRGSGNVPLDPADAFAKFRRDAMKDAEELVCAPKQFSMYVQIGQQESIEKISRVESSPNFVRWVDERLVALIRTAK
jgi:hypothetical protein